MLNLRNRLSYKPEILDFFLIGSSKIIFFIQYFYDTLIIYE
jgi:hypothetical protein